MEQKYEVVPNMISCKDLDYLSDMFNWNMGVYKNGINTIQNIKDEDVKKIFEKANNIFNGSISIILNIMNGGSTNE